MWLAKKKFHPTSVVPLCAELLVCCAKSCIHKVHHSHTIPCAYFFNTKPTYLIVTNPNEATDRMSDQFAVSGQFGPLCTLLCTDHFEQLKYVSQT